MLLDPSPDLPDDTEIYDVQFPIRIANVLKIAGIKTVGEIRKTPDIDLLRYPLLGRTRIDYLRKTLGGPFGL